jgi:hypothetical protein
MGLLVEFAIDFLRTIVFDLLTQRLLTFSGTTVEAAFLIIRALTIIVTLMVTSADASR